MFETEEHAGSIVWQVGGTPDVLECDLPVLHGTVAAVREGFLSIRRGGVEVGGVLFGTREESRVRILASRVVRCEYASGPSFVLSENDKTGLARLLESYLDDARLHGLVPVGWYHSHTRSEISLTEADREIHDRYFPEPWQIALVFRPDYFNPTRVGVFVREPDGKLKAEPDHAEFEVGPSPEPSLPRQTSHPASVAAAREQAADADLLPTLSAFSVPPKRRSRIWKPLFAALAVAAVVALAPLARRISFEPPTQTQPPPPSVSLHLQDQDGQLLILWDPRAKPVREAANAVLDITDGMLRTQIPLDAESLPRGSMPYTRYSGDVTVRMRILTMSAEAVDETARFLGQPPPLRPASETAEAKPAPELRTAGERPTPVPPKVRAAPSQPKAAPPPQPKPAPSAPAPAKPKPAEPELAQTAPRLFQPPAPRPFSGSAPSAPAAPESVPAAAPAASLASGRLVWSGVLNSNDTLTLTGRSASAGILTGELPNFPIRVAAYPAELSAQGLTVFSSDSRYSSGDLTEPPGPSNGWNRTTYHFDPALARGVVVVEPPGQNTGWNRIVLRNAGRTLSVIVLRWQRLPAQ